MNSQLFKYPIPKNIFVDFIRDNCDINNNFYILSKTTFRKAEYHKRIKPFCDSLLPYYHSSKRYYIERPLDYNKFITIIRQLCKACNAPYTSRILYNKSTYDILYYISLPSESG